jgi:hypothetical protein
MYNAWGKEECTQGFGGKARRKARRIEMSRKT